MSDRSHSLADKRSEGRGDRLRGKVALITGGASGIGRSTGFAFAAESAIVTLVDRAAATDLAEAKTMECSQPIAFAQLDVADESAVVDLISTLIARFGRIDIVVNSAGIAHKGRVHEINSDDWSRVMTNNLTSAYLICREALPHMMRARGGSIINISSGLGISGSHGHHVYAVSKAGIVALTRCMALAYGPYNIRANAICPGPISTPMLSEWLSAEDDSGASEHLVSRIPLGRLGTADEVASLALFLASNESSYITGAVITADGGERA